MPGKIWCPVCISDERAKEEVLKGVPCRMAVHEKNFRKKVPIRTGKPFFLHLPKGKKYSKLSLHFILELVYLWLHITCIIRDTARITQHSTATVVKW